MRERLIELIKETDKIRQEHNRTKDCYEFMCDETDCYTCDCGKRADYLLESGVIVPPCKVGDVVYTNFAMQGWYYRDKDRPYSAKIVFIGLNNSEEMGGGLINVLFKKNGNMMQFRFSDIGKTVFLTKEEAEQALGKLQASYKQVKGGVQG